MNDDTIAAYIGLGFLATLLTFITSLVVMFIGYQFTSNTPTYCYTEWRGADNLYEYKVSQHRRFGEDLHIAAVHTPEEAAKAIELLCH